jgi:hypothetical protein
MRQDARGAPTLPRGCRQGLILRPSPLCVVLTGLPSSDAHREQNADAQRDGYDPDPQPSRLARRPGRCGVFQLRRAAQLSDGRAPARRASMACCTAPTRRVGADRARGRPADRAGSRADGFGGQRSSSERDFGVGRARIPPAAASRLNVCLDGALPISLASVACGLAPTDLPHLLRLPNGDCKPCRVGPSRSVHSLNLMVPSR